jgi:hypothetical protein
VAYGICDTAQARISYRTSGTLKKLNAYSRKLSHYLLPLLYLHLKSEFLAFLFHGFKGALKTCLINVLHCRIYNVITVIREPFLSEAVSLVKAQGIRVKEKFQRRRNVFISISLRL